MINLSFCQKTIIYHILTHMVQWLTSQAENTDSIPELGRSPGEGNGNSVQYSCLENLMDRGVWQATVHGVARVGHNLTTKPPLLVFRNYGSEFVTVT